MEDDDLNGERGKDGEKGTEGKRAIHLVQRVLNGEHGLEQAGMALSYIVEHESWQEVGFTSFKEFALAPRKKHGLGVANLGAAKTLRRYLFQMRKYALWDD